MKQGFRLGAMFAAIGAMFQTRELQRALPPFVATGDDYSHPRNKHTALEGREGSAFIRKYRRHRNVKNEMAFQSRKRNR